MISHPALAALVLLLVPAAAQAQVDSRCQGRAQPSDYDEQTQQDFLQNYPALASVFAPIHAPIPHEPGHGTIGLELSVLPPLGCDKRFVLDWSKTEDTNKTPVIPRPRIRASLGAFGPVVVYVSFAYVPPVPFAGTRNAIVSGEIGGGVPVGEHVELGLRVHATSHKTVADIATAFSPGDPSVLDYYLANTFGADLLAGLRFGAWAPYLALGVTDVSTFFYIGDDGVVTDNLHPYAGLVGSLGIDGLIGKRLRLGGELWAAPGGTSLPDPSAARLAPFTRYGHLYTARLQLGVEL